MIASSWRTNTLTRYSGTAWGDVDKTIRRIGVKPVTLRCYFSKPKAKNLEGYIRGDRWFESGPIKFSNSERGSILSPFSLTKLTLQGSTVFQCFEKGANDWTKVVGT